MDGELDLRSFSKVKSEYIYILLYIVGRLEDSTGSCSARAESSDTLISVTHAKLITSGIIALRAGASSLSQLLFQIRQHDRQTLVNPCRYEY